MKNKLLEGIEKPEQKQKIEENFEQMISNYKTEQEKQLAQVQYVAKSIKNKKKEN